MLCGMRLCVMFICVVVSALALFPKETIGTSYSLVLERERGESVTCLYVHMTIYIVLCYGYPLFINIFQNPPG